MALLQREGGKTLDDALSELREATDFCRYYAAEGRNLFGAGEASSRQKSMASRHSGSWSRLILRSPASRLSSISHIAHTSNCGRRGPAQHSRALRIRSGICNLPLAGAGPRAPNSMPRELIRCGGSRGIRAASALAACR